MLSRIDRDADYGVLQPLLRGRINIDLILEQWDQLVRLAASLKDRLTRLMSSCSAWPMPTHRIVSPAP